MTVFSFILTERCNWLCEYCAFPYMQNKSDTTIDILRKHLPYIRRIKNQCRDEILVEIQGGEVGLLDIEVLREFCKLIDSKICVSTNGKFMEREYHKDPILRPYINEILWHVCPNPSTAKVSVDYNDDEIFINKGVVFTNEDYIEDFFKVNEHITFDFMDLECSIRKKNYMPSYAFRPIFERVKDIPNLTHNAKKRMYLRGSERENARLNCQMFHLSLVVDLVNEKICQCQRCPENNMDLTEENVITRLTNFLHGLFPGYKRGCESCIRLYFDKYGVKNLEQVFRNKRIFK